MHEFAGVKAALAAIEGTAAAAGVDRVDEVRLSIGPESHLGGGRLEDLLELLAPGSALEGADVMVQTDTALGGGIRVDFIVVSRTELV